MIEIEYIRHAWPEKAGFQIIRKSGRSDYTFLHFFGSVELLVDQKLINTRPHACIIYDIGTPQYFKSHQPLIHDWFHFTGDIVPFLEKYDLKFNTIYYPGNHEFITNIVKEMESERFSAGKYNRDLLQIKTEELLLKINRACSDEYIPAADTNTVENFRKLRGTVFSDLGHNWTTAEMADMVNLSKSRFYSVYKGIYGTSPVNDLIIARINSAKNALLFTNQSVLEISESLGYNNLTHFMRQFKSSTGCSPGEYRKQKGQ